MLLLSLSMDAADVAAEAATTRYAGRLPSASGLPGISLQVGVSRNRVRQRRRAMLIGPASRQAIGFLAVHQKSCRVGE